MIQVSLRKILRNDLTRGLFSVKQLMFSDTLFRKYMITQTGVKRLLQLWNELFIYCFKYTCRQFTEGIFWICLCSQCLIESRLSFLAPYVCVRGRLLGAIICNHQSKMDFDFVELTDMITHYGEAKRNGKKVFRNLTNPHSTKSNFLAKYLYTQCLFNFIKTFDKLLCPRLMGEGCNVRTTGFEEAVLGRFANELSTSTCAITYAVDTNQSLVWQVLSEENLYAYHL